MTRSQREAVVLRNLPATEATLGYLLANADHARQALESLRSRNVVEESGGRWQRRSTIRTFHATH